MKSMAALSRAPKEILNLLLKDSRSNIWYNSICQEVTGIEVNTDLIRVTFPIIDKVLPCQPYGRSLICYSKRL